MIAKEDFWNTGHHSCELAVAGSGPMSRSQLRVGHPDIGSDSGMGAVSWNTSCSHGGIENRAICCVRQALAEYTCLV